MIQFKVQIKRFESTERSFVHIFKLPRKKDEDLQ